MFLYTITKNCNPYRWRSWLFIFYLPGGLAAYLKITVTNQSVHNIYKEIIIKFKLSNSQLYIVLALMNTAFSNKITAKLHNAHKMHLCVRSIEYKVLATLM